MAVCAAMVPVLTDLLDRLLPDHLCYDGVRCVITGNLKYRLPPQRGVSLADMFSYVHH